MSFTAILGPLFTAVTEVTKLWAENERTRFLEEYHDILTDIATAKNQPGKLYTDSEVDVLSEKLVIFLKAFENEVKMHNSKNIVSDSLN